MYHPKRMGLLLEREMEIRNSLDLYPLNTNLTINSFDPNEELSKLVIDNYLMFTSI